MFLRKTVAALAAAFIALPVAPAMAQSTGFAEFLARVGTAGALLRGSGVISSVEQSTAFYSLVFARDVSGCYVFVSTTGSSGFAISAQNPSQPETVKVSTFDKDGVPARRSFFVLVRCQD